LVLARIKRDSSELIDALREQLTFLRTSATAVDRGEQYEFKRLALTLRVLLHSGKAGGVSLLDQLDLLDQMELLDTAGANPPRNVMPAQHMLAMKLITWGDDAQPGRGEYVARMGILQPFKISWQEQVHELAAGRPAPRKAGTYLPFPTWWAATVITDDQAVQFSRQRLVLAVANTDGGGHVDPRLDEDYHALSRSNSLGWIMNDGPGRQHPFENPVPASIRQIAYELDVSLVRALPGLDLGPTPIGPGPTSPRE
jgi:hypothetical protein